MSEPQITLKDWADRTANMPIDLSFLDENEIMKDPFAHYGPLKPWPWYKRWAASIGDRLIHIGIHLGGSYE